MYNATFVGLWEWGKAVSSFLVASLERKSLKVTVHLFLWCPFFAVATKKGIKDYPGQSYMSLKVWYNNKQYVLPMPMT